MMCFPFFSERNKKKDIEVVKSAIKVDRTNVDNAPVDKTTVKEICFPDITYDGHPYIWYFYPEHNLAIWTSELAGNSSTYSHAFLLSCLDGIAGISIRDNEAYINDVRTFLLGHQMISIRRNPGLPHEDLPLFTMK